MKLYGRWKVTLPDEEFVWEPDEVTFSEQLMIENEADCSYDEWILDGVSPSRAVPCQILVWFLRYKAGQQQERYAVEFPIRKLTLEKIDEPVALPESPAGSEQSEPATSQSSPTTTGSVPSTGVLSLAKTS